MFCKKCGKELEDNVRFCNYCGAEVESKVVDFNEAVGNNKPDNSYANAGGQKYNYEYVMPQQPVQAAAGQPVEEDVSINIAGHKIKGRLIMKIAAIVAAACFFFPMFTVSCAGVNVGSVSMADLTFETEDTTQDSYYDYYDSDEEENGTVGMIVFLLAPISAFCICMVKNEGKGWGKEAVAAFGSSALALISLYFVITNTMNDEYGGDVQAKPQVINMFEDLQESMNLTYLFIAHDLSVVKHISNRIGVMYLGRMVELADSYELTMHSLHPYTKSLISAIPIADPKQARASKRIALEGDVPSPLNPPSGCRFRTRCPYADEQCAKEVPEFKEVAPGHYAACHHLDKCN